MQRRWRSVLQKRLTDGARQHHPLRKSTTIAGYNIGGEEMANFARSLKSPYLSPRLRPSMPGRTLSSSSDVSHPSPNSPLSEDFADLSVSGHNTPTFLNERSSKRGVSRDADGVSIRDEHGIVASPSYSRPTTPRSHSSRSRPIAIELPNIKRFGTAPACTPPEPLSARGDLPGGYFPLHEDPNSRVHHPHPFQAHKDNRMTRHQSLSLAADSRSVYADRPTSNLATTLSVSHSNTPVASYIPAGFHDNPLPMGKYYPSNYEQRTSSQSSLQTSFAGSISANFRSESHITPRTTDVPQIATPESEVQRRLQQYQRDMVAQASMAASELLGSPTSSSINIGSNVSLSSMRIREGQFKPPAPLKPTSPRLIPLGSPGPVTPMSLESSAGGYLNLGRTEASGRDRIGSTRGH